MRVAWARGEGGVPAEGELVLGERRGAGGGARARREARAGREGIHGHKGPGDNERGDRAEHRSTVGVV